MNPRFVKLDRPGVKICGITSSADAHAAAGAGADALGFNFWPGSKRYLPVDRFVRWAAELPETVDRVGVFVNGDASQVLELLESGAIHAAQFHGDESAEYCDAFIGKHPVIRAFGIRSRESLAAVSACRAGTVLLDAYCPKEYGGSGESFDWELARQFIAENAEHRVVLAGGLAPENVAAAIAGVRPSAVDVASGVESAPGVKELRLVKDFIAAALGG